MHTNETQQRVRGWFAGRLPSDWLDGEPTLTVDREEIVVVLPLPTPDLPENASDVERAEAAAGRAKAFREDTRAKRIEIAREAEQRFERTISWGVAVGDHRELFTHLAAPAMTRLRQPQRLVLDTLVEAGVARSRADALAWCVRLVGQHEAAWLEELRTAMDTVTQVRDRGPSA